MGLAERKREWRRRQKDIFGRSDIKVISIKKKLSVCLSRKVCMCEKKDPPNDTS